MSFNALKIVNYKIITAVLQQHVSPFPRNYRDLRPHLRGVTVRSVPITAEYPRLPRYYRDPHPRAALYEELCSINNTFVLLAALMYRYTINVETILVETIFNISS